MTTETVPLSCSESASHVSCESKTPLVPYDQLEVHIFKVQVLGTAAVTGERGEVGVSSGGAPPVSLIRGRWRSRQDRSLPCLVSKRSQLSPEEEGGGTEYAGCQPSR